MPGDGDPQSTAPPPRVAAQRRRTHLVAAFVLFHVCGMTLQACPSPEGAMDRAAWKHPTAQGEFAERTRQLNRIGLHLSTADFEDWLWRLATRYLVVRRALLAPWAAYSRYLGAEQSWRMFVAPDRFPARLVIDVEERGRWRTVYRERSATERWLGHELDDYRYRSLLFRFGWPNYAGVLQQFAGWVARRAAHDFPAATRVRVTMSAAPTPSPAEVRAHLPAPAESGPSLVRTLDGLRR